MAQLPEYADGGDNPESSSPEVTTTVELTYPWTADLDEWRRAFIFEHMADRDWDGKCLVEAMRAVERWMRGQEAELMVISGQP